MSITRSSDKVVYQTNGAGLSTLLFVAFLVLKLTHVIGWSWWWVTAPLWIPVVFVIGLLTVVFLIALIVAQ